MTARQTLASLLRSRSRSDRVGFVAALYAARGATTRVEGNVVRVDGERYLVASRWPLLAGVRSPPAGAVDCVVCVDPHRAARLARRYDARAVSATDLDRLLRYGLDRARADALSYAQFDRSIDTVAPPPADERGTAPPRTQSLPGRVGGSTVTGIVAALAVAFLLSTVAFAGAGATPAALPWVWDASESVSVSTPAVPTPPADSTTSTPAPTTAHSWVGPGGHDIDADGFAPGVSQAGITDTDALAAAHAAALGNHSYRWELLYVESVDDTVTARGTESVGVASRRRFVSRVDWRGTPVGFTPVASQPSYADGTARHRPTADGSVVTHSLTDLAPAGEQGWRASRYVRWYLSANSSSVERTLIHTERPTAVVEATGTTYPNAENYTVRAHVTDAGFVQSMTVSYTLTTEDGTRVSVWFSFRYQVDDAVSIAPPTWYDAEQARRAG